MAVLTTRTRGGHVRGSGRRLRSWLLTVALLCAFPFAAPGQTAVSREYQVKAVFLFNFAQFVDWPADAFPNDQAPLVIGVLGEDPFGPALDEAVRGEKINGRSLVVRRFVRVEDVDVCHIIFVSRSENTRLEPIIARLSRRSILTVSDAENFTLRGGMIRFLTENNKVRLRINVEAAKAAGLTISSKLLRPAEIVTAPRG